MQEMSDEELRRTGTESFKARYAEGEESRRSPRLATVREASVGTYWSNVTLMSSSLVVSRCSELSQR